MNNLNLNYLSGVFWSKVPRYVTCIRLVVSNSEHYTLEALDFDEENGFTNTKDQC
jgi:hypothetical protein